MNHHRHKPQGCGEALPSQVAMAGNHHASTTSVPNFSPWMGRYPLPSGSSGFQPQLAFSMMPTSAIDSFLPGGISRGLNHQQASFWASQPPMIHPVGVSYPFYAGQACVPVMGSHPITARPDASVQHHLPHPPKPSSTPNVPKTGKMIIADFVWTERRNLCTRLRSVSFQKEVFSTAALVEPSCISCPLL